MVQLPRLGAALGDCDRPLIEAYDAALLDLDGVLYLGPEPVRHAARAVAAAAAHGLRLAYVTNNASRSPDEVALHLTEIGIPATPADVVTSGQAATRLVAARVPAGSAVLVLGSDALREQVRAAGLIPVRAVAEAGPGGPVAVVQGLATDTGWRDLAEAALAIRAGALWVTGNLDATLPTPRGPLPGNGAMVAALRAATGAEPVVAGKPEPALHEESVQRTGARRPLVVGDRLDTDVLGAVRAAAHSLLVLTGVVDLAALLRAPKGSRPHYVGADLRALLRPQPPVRIEGDRIRCGTALAGFDDGVLLVSVEGHDPDGQAGVDALRAACSAAWRVVDGGRTVQRVSGLGDDGSLPGG